MALIVKKFGGSSVGSTEKIMNVAKRVISEKKPEDQIVMVVSAMGDTTDDLIDLAKKINKDPYRYEREMDMLLTTGEQVSIALLTMAFKTLGQKAVSLTGPMAGMHTDSTRRGGAQKGQYRRRGRIPRCRRHRRPCDARTWRLRYIGCRARGCASCGQLRDFHRRRWHIFG